MMTSCKKREEISDYNEDFYRELPEYLVRGLAG
jgi:hypothetical protein